MKIPADVKRKDVFTFVYKYLQSRNSTKKVYVNDATIEKIVAKKFGADYDWDIDYASSSAVSQYYESKEFMDKL
jgi:hypothetical protein